MRILVFGAGVIGSLYAALLAGGGSSQARGKRRRAHEKDREGLRGLYEVRKACLNV